MAAGESGVRWVVEQLMAMFPGPVTTHVIEPAGVNPEVPVTTTVRVVVPPKVRALLEIPLIVGTRVAMPTVT